MNLADWSQGTTPESLKCYYWTIIMELLRWNCDRWDFSMVHPWLAQHRRAEPCPQEERSLFFILYSDGKKQIIRKLLQGSYSPLLSNHLAAAEGSQLGDFPAATISQQPRAETKWWHKGLCSSFIPQLSFCLCHPPCSPPPTKPFTYRNSGKEEKIKNP